jgi:hypothetical protein
MKSSRLAIVCLLVLVTASIWMLLAAKRAATLRSGGPVGRLPLVSTQFRSHTNSGGHQVTDVSLTISNASPRTLDFRLVSLDWMVNNTGEHGSLGGLTNVIATVPCGAMTNITLCAQSEVPFLIPNTTFRCGITYWEEPQEPSLLRTMVEQVEFVFSITLWNFPPQQYGTLYSYSDRRQADAFEHRFSETLLMVRPGIKPDRVTTSQGPNQEVQQTPPRLDVSNDP